MAHLDEGSWFVARFGLIQRIVASLALLVAVGAVVSMYLPFTVLSTIRCAGPLASGNVLRQAPTGSFVYGQEGPICAGDAHSRLVVFGVAALLALVLGVAGWVLPAGLPWWMTGGDRPGVASDEAESWASSEPSAAMPYEGAGSGLAPSWHSTSWNGLQQAPVNLGGPETPALYNPALDDPVLEPVLDLTALERGAQAEGPPSIAERRPPALPAPRQQSAPASDIPPPPWAGTAPWRAGDPGQPGGRRPARPSPESVDEPAPLPPPPASSPPTRPRRPSAAPPPRSSSAPPQSSPAAPPQSSPAAPPQSSTLAKKPAARAASANQSPPPAKKAAPRRPRKPPGT
ncbi:MAG: hypothetical protein ACYC1D_01735 [Acidimicrobiales bacterium]